MQDSGQAYLMIFEEGYRGHSICLVAEPACQSTPLSTDDIACRDGRVYHSPAADGSSVLATRPYRQSPYWNLVRIGPSLVPQV